ncbi:azadirone synthase LFS-like [Apium graveolens]|uniref:azadirone synthase LFS-like n=1 Tax=Apium graveolens TaxID=4045 RepID=UPI003D7AE6CB
MAKKDLELAVIDLSCSDRVATANSIHQACMDTGFFYLINHGVENELIQKALEESRNFFSLPLEEKMKVAWKEHRGYTPLCSERLDTSLRSTGDLKETIYIGPLEDDKSYLNQWPSREILPFWRFTMELYYEKVRDAGRRLISLIALALNLEEDFFVKVGPLDPFLRLLHYPGEQGSLDEQVLGASAHSDYGMMTLLMTDGIPGLQVCREKSKQPQVWENVHHISGAFVVNIGDMMERWTNCLYRSTLHRVIRTGQERYSMAFFLNPFQDSVVECLKSCCTEASPPRFPPIRSGDYLKERYRAHSMANIEYDATA